jgi:hypothetical protein
MEIPSFIGKDIRELVAIIVAHGVDFVLVGGHAVGFHGHLRATMDVDFLIRPGEDNNARMMAALNEFGFGQAGIDPSIFKTEGHMLSIGAKPNEVDFVTSLSGCATDDIFDNAVMGKIGDTPLKIIGLPELLLTKRAAGRPKDRIDVEELEAIRAMAEEERHKQR